MPIPALRPDGYLPDGIHGCTKEELLERSGGGNARRKRLGARIKHWLDLGRAVGARRLLVDGSFITSKREPADVDAVIQLTAEFAHAMQQGDEAALELFEIITTRQPEELFAAEDDQDWERWAGFFSRTREPDGRRKGLLEVAL